MNDLPLFVSSASIICLKAVISRNVSSIKTTKSPSFRIGATWSRSHSGVSVNTTKHMHKNPANWKLSIIINFIIGCSKHTANLYVTQLRGERTKKSKNFYDMSALNISTRTKKNREYVQLNIWTNNCWLFFSFRLNCSNSSVSFRGFLFIQECVCCKICIRAIFCNYIIFSYLVFPSIQTTNKYWNIAHGNVISHFPYAKLHGMDQFVF